MPSVIGEGATLEELLAERIATEAAGSVGGIR